MTMYRPEKADELIRTAQAMVAPGKGILAIDESNGTCNKRFEAVGIDPGLRPEQIPIADYVRLGNHLERKSR